MVLHVQAERRELDAVMSLTARSPGLDAAPVVEEAKNDLERDAALHSGFWLAGVVAIALLERRRRRGVAVELAAKEAGARAESAIEQILQNTADAVRITDLENRIVRVNPQFVRLFDIPAERLVGRLCREVLPHADCGTDHCAIAQVAAGAQRVERESDICVAAGRVSPCLLSAIPYRDTQGRVAGAITYFKDISDLRRAEQEREEHLRLLRDLLEAMPNPIFYKDRNGVYRLCNSAFAEQLGRRREEIIGRTDADLYPPETATAAAARDVELLTNPGVELNEIAAPGPGGRPREFLVTRAALPDDHGGARGIVGVHLEITSRKRAERALAESEGRYRLLFESAADAILIHNASQRFVAVNETAGQLLDYSRQELWQKTLVELAAPECREEVARNLRLLESTGRRTFEALLIRGDGDRLPVEINARAIEHSQQPAVLSIVRDASARKKAEEELKRLVELLVASNDSLEKLNTELSSRNDQLRREIAERRRAETALAASEDRYRRLVEGAPSLVAVIADDRVAYLNAAGARLLGAGSAQELIGLPVSEFLAPADAQRVAARLTETVAQGAELTLVEERLVDRKGRAIRLELSISPTEHRGRPAAQVVGYDVTERRAVEEQQQRLEEQLRQAQKLESIGRLAGGVAHDFNNILTGIMGYSDLLLAETLDPTARTEILKEMRVAAERASRITQQLLAFSRRQTITPRPLDLNEVIAEAGKMLKRLIGEDISLVFHPTPHLGRTLLDVGQFEQILVNLAVNARDAMPNGGLLAIQTRNVELDEERCAGRPDLRPGPYVLVTIGDNGAGMDAEVLAHIFEPFFTTKEFGKGTGLGLSTVYGIMQQNHGAIEVQSQPGVGSSFKLYFPRVESEQAAQRPPAEASLPRGSETVMVVEDEEMVRQLACRVLARQGYRVIEAVDGEDALAKARSLDGRLDLVLTDVVMPRLNGRELVETLGRERSDFRVLYMSGYTDEILGRHGVLDQETLFIAKPFTIESLASRVRTALDQPLGGSG
jgi:PAS domain S-box-containing protein